MPTALYMKTDVELVKSARKNSTEDMERLLERLGEIPPAMRGTVFEVFRFHLQKPCVPMANQESQGTRAALVGLSIAGMYQLGPEFFANALRAKHLGGCWRDVLRWLGCMAGLSSNDQTVQLLVTNTIALFKESDTVAHAVLKDFDAFHFAIEHWNRDTSRLRHGSLPLAIIASFFNNKTNTKPLMKVAFEFLPEKGADVANICFERLLSTLSSFQDGSPAEIMALCCDVDILWMLIKGDLYDAGLLFWSDLEGGARVVISALRFLTISKLESENVTRSMCHCVHLLHQYVKDYMDMEIALNDGLLACFYELAKSFHLLDGEHQELALNIASKLVNLLSNASILAKITEELKRIRPQLPGAEDEAFNELVKRLTLLEAVALDRMVLKNLRELEDQDELAFCNNPNCVKVELRSKFKKCERCIFSLYCSRACQAEAWKEHKGYCSIIKYEDKHDRIGALNLIENRFPRKVATSEVKRHLTSFVALAKRTHPDTPISRMGYDINTTVFPLQVGAFRVETYANHEDPNPTPGSLLTRVIAVAKEALWKADNWKGDYQPTMLKVKQDTNSFVCIIPLRRDDVKAAEERATQDNPAILAGEGTNSFIRCEDKRRNPLTPSERDEIQEIVHLIKERAGSGSPWKDTIIQGAIDDHLAGHSHLKLVRGSAVEQRALTLYCDLRSMYLVPVADSTV